MEKMFPLFINEGDKIKDVDFETHFHLMDANDLTFEDESFDVVIGGAILHHLDVEQSLYHAYRVLKRMKYESII